MEQVSVVWCGVKWCHLVWCQMVSSQCCITGKFSCVDNLRYYFEIWSRETSRVIAAVDR